MKKETANKLIIMGIVFFILYAIFSYYLFNLPLYRIAVILAIILYVGYEANNAPLIDDNE